MNTIAERLADWSSSLRFEDIPEQVVRELEWHALDTVGVMIGATSLCYARHLAASVLLDGGLGEATLFGDGRKVPTRDAAFVNGCLGHGIDWDDTHLDALLHPTATILPAVLAIAEARGASGSQMLTPSRSASKPRCVSDLLQATVSSVAAYIRRPCAGRSVLRWRLRGCSAWIVTRLSMPWASPVECAPACTKASSMVR